MLKQQGEEKIKPVINTHGIEAGCCYKHYKGNTYFVIGFSIFESTGETLVTYKFIYDKNQPPFTRFAKEFLQEVQPGVTRFKLIEKKN